MTARLIQVPTTAAENPRPWILLDDGSAIPVVGVVNGDGSLVDPATPIIAAGSNVIGKVDHTSTGIGHGVKTVSAAGTDEALAASTAAKWVEIQAQTDNTGLVAVGAAGVDATVATGNGVLLSAGERIGPIPIDNLADIYVDATVSGDGVRYIYGT